jgi:hypothetical protein
MVRPGDRNIALSWIEKLRDRLAHRRKYAPFFDWHEKSRKELGVVEQLVRTMEARGEVEYRSLRCWSQDPPDCIGKDNTGKTVAFEVTELVSEEAVRMNQKGRQVYRDWRPAEVVNRIDEILKDKDSKVYSGGPYCRIAVLIHTAEQVISFEEYGHILAEHTFGPLKQVTEAFLLMHYDPRLGNCPYIRLSLARST